MRWGERGRLGGRERERWGGKKNGRQEGKESGREVRIEIEGEGLNGKSDG